MTSAILVVRLGRLHMGEFQYWIAVHGLDPRVDPQGAGLGAAPLVSVVVSHPGVLNGSCPVQEGGLHQRQPDGLGGCPRRPEHERLLDF